MKNYLLLVLICLFNIQLFAQELSSSLPKVYSKIDAQLIYWLSEPLGTPLRWPELFQGSQTNPMIPIIFKSFSANTATLVEKHGGQLHSTIGQIFTAVIPLSKVIAFASEQDIIRVESSQRAHLTNDKARQLIGADRVNAGELAGGIPYTEKELLSEYSTRG